jgi:hypothetical protein
VITVPFAGATGWTSSAVVRALPGRVGPTRGFDTLLLGDHGGHGR